MKWRIYYGDGSTFSSEDGAPHEIPPEKRHDVMVCAVANIDHTGRDCWNQSDFYIHHAEIGWTPVDWTGLLDQMLHNTHLVTAVLQGRVTSDQRFQEILQRAKTEQGLPRKSADRERERTGQQYGPPRNN